MATTAATIITTAFIKVGVNTPSTAQTTSALISFNNLISMMGAEKFVNIVLTASKALTVGTATYTLGAAGDWAIARPIGIRNAYLLDSDSRSYPLELLGNRDFNDIRLKSHEARPTGIFFLPEYPLAKLIFNSEPTVADTVYCEFYRNFVEFAASTTDLELTIPLEYKEAFVYNLAVSLGEDFQRTIPETVLYRARETREIIDKLNASANPPPKARFDCFGIDGRNRRTVMDLGMT